MPKNEGGFLILDRVLPMRDENGCFLITPLNIFLSEGSAMNGYEEQQMLRAVIT